MTDALCRTRVRCGIRAGTSALIGAVLFACSGSDNKSLARPAARETIVADTAPTAPTAAPLPREPLSIDTANTRTLELWSLDLEPARQVDETRRIVVHLQADFALVPGFNVATLLASGDGTRLVLLIAWRDSLAATTARPLVLSWLRAETDTAQQRIRTGSATRRVLVRKTVGTPPQFTDAAMMLLTRYAMKPGHSFGALAALADSNLATRVLQDTSAQGGASLAAADSGAVYTLTQARNATALDPRLFGGGARPFWAPFAVREENLLAVVATIFGR